MAVLTPLSEADAWETAEEDVVPGGAPTLAAVPGVHPPLAILTDGAPPLDSRAPDVAGGGAPPLSALLATTRAPTPLPPALYEAAHRFFRGRERWAEVNSMSPCIGSRYWEHHLPEDQSIEGIAPLEFFGPHPVWEGFAVPVRRNAKVKHFYCTFCKKVLPGEANRAYDHIVKGQAKKCGISMACKEFLVRKKNAFSERRSILHSKKNQVNDGVTTWEQMNADTLMAKLMVELSQHNDCETWYGTTGVVVMAEALLEQAEQLLERGVHPVRIAEGYEIAAKIALDHLQYLSQRFSADNIEPLVQILMTTLSPKIANHCKRPLAEIAAKAVLAVADIERRDVNLDLIKVEGKAGGKPEDTELVYGIVVGKYMSLPEVPIRIEDAKVAILTCSYEPQNPQAKHRHQQEQKYFDEMVQKCKDVGATLAICQWGFDEEPNHLMMHTSLPAVRWVKFDDLESIAMATGGHTVPRFQELSPGKLGKAGLVREKTFGTGKDLILFIEQCVNSRAVTIFVRGENTMIVEEMKQSVKDALSMASNLFGGGSVDTSCAVSVETAADHYPGFEQDAIRSFAYALDSIPGAKNNSLPHPVGTLTEVKAQEVFGTMICKRQQNILHATRVVKIILKMALNCD